MKTEPHDRKKYKRGNPIIYYIVIPLVALLVKIILVSCRLTRTKGADLENRALEETGGKAVYATWHQRIFFHARGLANKDLTIMVSQSRDGEYAARLARFFKVKTVRGSSTRGGSNALKELTDRIEKEGTNGGMVVDGPVGPARVAKIGAAVMARNARVPLIPRVWSADRCWILNSWDRLIIPKPFARIVYCHADPILIPDSAKGKELEKYRKLLEERLNEATAWCDNQFGEEKPWHKTKV
jgi:lysophospholipid acyltransferase (LPLAT)-like uncharacterized protein